jgi:meso-butanediol dehydrogenase/(S,S)-butanediol dehydrogenase/diacetyl reductase
MSASVALVTGAGRGIGRAIAERLAEDGWTLAVNDIDAGSAAGVAEALRGAGRTAAAFPADVTDLASVRAMVEAVERELGPLGALVNNAGVISASRFTELAEAEWDRVLRVNLKGPFLCAQAVVGGMVERGFGRIVTIASDAAKTAEPFIAHYCASKFGVVGLTQSLALEVAGAGVTVNAVCPAICDTEMMEELAGAYAGVAGIESRADARAAFVAEIPMGRAAVPADVAEVVSFLCGDRSDFISGQAINVSGAHELH